MKRVRDHSTHELHPYTQHCVAASLVRDSLARRGHRGSYVTSAVT